MNSQLQYRVEQFLYRNAEACDAQDWDTYLDMFSEDSEFHLPQWDSEHVYTSDPKKAMSLIYYPNRGGLEDRVFRIKTERSSATVPDTRTSHNISNIEIVEQGEGSCQVRFNWHTLSFRYKTTDSYFGTSFYTLDLRGEQPLIKAKKVVLKNDYVRQVIDIYHI